MLGTHVLRCADCQARLGELLLARGDRGARDAEVDHESVAVFKHDVFGLHVAVHDPLGVRVRERVGYFGSDLDGVVDAQRPTAVQSCSERVPGNEGHDVVEWPSHSPESYNGKSADD